VRSLGKCLGAHRVENVVSGTGLLARFRAAVLATQPLALDEMRSTDLSAKPAPAESLDSPAVKRRHNIVLGEQLPARLTSAVPNQPNVKQ
jgi:hypothetical protein